MLNLAVSTKGQFVIPSEMRARLGIEPGSRINLRETPDGLLLTKAPAFKPTAKGAASGALANARRVGSGMADEADLMAYLLSKDKQTKSLSIAETSCSGSAK
jgi:AbrB family looped-hinge helix DNA binding protein